MPNEPRPLGQQELDLVETLQPLMRREDDKLPAACEIEPGYFLRLVLDTWSNGAGRDGRKGHLTDSDIASELGRRTGERFDRNRYQATFGLGKKMADGTRQPQPVTRTVAKALLEIALRNWDPPLDRSGSKAPDTTPFAQLPHSRLDIAIETALKSMYGEDVHNVREVRCQKVVGVGWKGLYQELGAEGFTVVVIARDDALRMRDPKTDIFELSDMLNRLLCADKSRSVNALHIWAIRRPEQQLAQRILVRELDGIGTLQSKLKTIKYLNCVPSNGWTPVDLDRCIVAEAASYSAHPDLFNLGVGNQARAEIEQSEEPIAVLAISPEREVRFYTFSLRRSPPVAPFVQRVDLPTAAKEEILKLVDDARAGLAQDNFATQNDWHYYKAVKFASDWDWQIKEDEV